MQFTQNIMIQESHLIQFSIRRSRFSQKLHLVHLHAREKNLKIGITDHE